MKKFITIKFYSNNNNRLKICDLNLLIDAMKMRWYKQFQFLDIYKELILLKLLFF